MYNLEKQAAYLEETETLLLKGMNCILVGIGMRPLLTIRLRVPKFPSEAARARHWRWQTCS